MSFKRILASLAVVILMFASLGHAGAASEPGSGLTLSPTRGEYIVNKGKSDTVKISLKNKSGAPVTAKVVINDFTADNRSGEPIIQVKDKADSATSVKKFLSNVNDVTLDTDETKKIEIPINIPENATSGAYYGVIRYTAVAGATSKTAGSQVGLTASVGYIVLIQVPGNITEQIQAQKIAVSRNDVNGSLFIAPPTKGNITLKNTGNGFTKPFGRVSITKGGKEVYSYEMNNTDPRSNILPGSSRTFSDDIKNVSTFGRYTISTGVSYGTGGNIITLKSSFWVFPVWTVIVFAVAFIVILLVGFLVYRHLGKRRSRRS
ncbi:hypothetical protein BH10PAT3_BH10PAT3_2700 [soil metagenome]